MISERRFESTYKELKYDVFGDTQYPELKF